MDCTDRHDRYFLRLMSKNVMLYSEMVATKSAIHGDRKKILSYSPEEKPLALQVGGSDKAELAEVAKIAEDMGYDEININLGCPSKKVQKNMFGACLMREPDLVAECIDSMVNACKIPVTAKTRIGFDDTEEFDYLNNFILRMKGVGCSTFILHARKANEYQGKQLFAKFGLPVSRNKVITSAEEAINACRDIGGTKWVIKAQVHAGGRGKAGGVKLINTPEEAVDFSNHWLGKRLVTYQTDAQGQLVNSILIEECTDIAQELYLSAVVDRGTQRIVFIGSSEGGVNIEEVAEKTPEKIIYEPIDPLTGPMPFQARKISKILGLNPEQSKEFSKMLPQLTDLFLTHATMHLPQKD